MNLFEERLNRGLSLNAAAMEMGVHREVLRRLEVGEPVSPASAKKVADFYGCTVMDLWPDPQPKEAA